MAELLIFPVIVLCVFTVVPKTLFKLTEVLTKRKLKKMLIKRTFKSDSKDICIICQDDYHKVKKCAELYCGHKYHKKCIFKWMRVKLTCPLCNEGILLKNRKRMEVN